MRMLGPNNTHEKKRSKYGFIFKIIIFVILLISIMSFNVFDFIRVKVIDCFFFLTKPAQMLTELSSNMQLANDNSKIIDEIKTKNIALLHQVNELNYLKFENEKLRKLLQIEKFNGYDAVGAKINFNINYEKKENFVFINKGSANGLKIGSAVINEKGLIGRITQIGSDWSQVMLVQNLGTKLPVLMVNSKVEALISGDSKDAIVEFVSENKEILDNDTVVTAGNGELFPRGIPIGIYKNKKISLFAITKNLDHVVVLKEKLQTKDDSKKIDPKYIPISSVKHAVKKPEPTSTVAGIPAANTATAENNQGKKPVEYQINKNKIDN